jgi:hypothetical protein
VNSCGALAVVLIVLAGCGDDTHQARKAERPQQGAPSESRGAAKGEEEHDKGGLSSIPVEDRRAFLQIGVASSNLRSGASLLLVKGFVPPRQKLTLVRLLDSVRRLKPRDAQLRRLRVETLSALLRGIRAPRAARAMLGDANRIQQGLKRYSTAKPAIGAIAPE